AVYLEWTSCVFLLLLVVFFSRLVMASRFFVRSSSPEKVTLVEDEEHDQSPIHKYQFDWKCALPVTTMSLIPTLYRGDLFFFNNRGDSVHLLACKGESKKTGKRLLWFSRCL